MIYPHGDIETVASDIFMVRGSIKMNAMLRITRNMAIVRHNGELSLINPIRLNAKVEQALRDLGEVKHIIRLGCFHGVDDPYYVETFGAKHWSQTGGTAFTEPNIDNPLTDEAELPFSGGRLFLFKETKQPECVLLMERDGGVLLTCDAIQHYGDYSYNNIPARIIMPFIGFPRTTIVGPLWLKGMTPENGSLESEFRDLLKLSFDKLLSAHGTLLTTGAHAAVATAVENAYHKN